MITLQEISALYDNLSSNPFSNTWADQKLTSPPISGVGHSSDVHPSHVHLPQTSDTVRGAFSRGDVHTDRFSTLFIYTLLYGSVSVMFTMMSS